MNSKNLTIKNKATTEFSNEIKKIKEIFGCEAKFIDSIVGNNNYYVSNDGRIFYKSDQLKQKSTRIDKKTGYKMVSFNGGKKVSTVHRLVALAFCDNYNEQVHHEDGNKLNNNSDNLKWVSQKEHDKLTQQQINNNLK